MRYGGSQPVVHSPRPRPCSHPIDQGGSGGREQRYLGRRQSPRFSVRSTWRAIIGYSSQAFNDTKLTYPGGPPDRPPECSVLAPGVVIQVYPSALPSKQHDSVQSGSRSRPQSGGKRFEVAQEPEPQIRRLRTAKPPLRVAYTAGLHANRASTVVLALPS